MREKLNDHDREISLLAQAVTEIRTVLSSDQEIKKDMRDEMREGRKTTERLIEVIGKLNNVDQEVKSLKEAKDSCIKEGCPKAQDAHKIASGVRNDMQKILWGIAGVVGLAVLSLVVTK